MRGVRTSAAIVITTGALFAASAGSASFGSPAQTAAQGPIEDLFAVLAAVETVCEQAEQLPELPETDVPDTELPGVDLPSPDIRGSQPPDDLTAAVTDLCAAFENLSLEELESILDTLPELPEVPADDLPELPGL
ncbi:hypothetical protein [Nocardiopsis rhodophaea]|uniref:hypothetical protein n=1 Tax=Nocardiopsis rhodophaea TaxID=280238 RepID=UPI0031D5A8C5